MSRFVTSEIAETAGNVSANFAIQAASKAANFACQLYRDFPKSMIDGIPNLKVSFAKGFLDGLCADRSPGLPPTPELPFTGGQCHCVLYECDVLINGNFSTFNKFWGEIVATRNRVVRINELEHVNFYEVLCRGDDRAPCQENLVWITTRQSPNRDPNHKVTIIVKKRADNLPDACGDPPVDYPDVPIPEERMRDSITIKLGDLPDVTVPVVYSPVSIKAPLTLNVDQVDFKFDFGGVTVDDVPDNTADNLTDILQRLSEIDFILGDITEDINNVRKDTKKIQQDVDKPPPNSDSEDYDEDIKDESDDKEESNIENLAYVKIELLTIPKNAKSQSGNDAPTVYYAGWFEFRTGDWSYPREYIHFQSSIFEAPSGADGYAYTLYKGYTGRAIVIKQKEPA